MVISILIITFLSRTWCIYVIILNPLFDCGLKTDVGRKKAGWANIPLKPSWYWAAIFLQPPAVPNQSTGMSHVMLSHQYRSRNWFKINMIILSFFFLLTFTSIFSFRYNCMIPSHPSKSIHGAWEPVQSFYFFSSCCIVPTLGQSHHWDRICSCFDRLPLLLRGVFDFEPEVNMPCPELMRSHCPAWVVVEQSSEQLVLSKLSFNLYFNLPFSFSSGGAYSRGGRRCHGEREPHQAYSICRCGGVWTEETEAGRQRTRTECLFGEVAARG